MAAGLAFAGRADLVEGSAAGRIDLFGAIVKFPLSEGIVAFTLFFSAALLSNQSTALAQETSAPLKRPDIENVVREYILQHPEVLLDSIRMYQERERGAQQQKLKDAVKQHQADLINDAAAPFAGDPGSAVTMVEFFDYHCGYCKQVAPTVAKLLSGRSNLRVVFKEFPILGPDSTMAAKAALAAHRQGAYFRFHQALMGSSEPISPGAIERLAAKLGLDVPKLKADMESQDIKAALERNLKLAEAIGVSSTPTFVLGSELVAGAMSEDSFRSLIKAQEAKVAPKIAAP